VMYKSNSPHPSPLPKGEETFRIDYKLYKKQKTSAGLRNRAKNMVKRDNIVCYECGSGERAWSGTRSSLGGDYEALVAFGKKGLLDIECSKDDVQINGTDKVGTLLLPSGRRIIIKSKIPNVVVLQWLQFLGEFPDLEGWENEPGVTDQETLQDCIAQLFIHELFRLTQQFMRKDFVPVQHSSSTIHGKVLARRLCQAMHKLPSVPQLARVRTYDSLYNIVLAIALDKTLPLLSDENRDKHDMARLREEWAYISRDVPDVISAVINSQWTCPFGYRSALQLARLIILGRAAIDAESGVGGEIFTISLEKIWEDGLREIFEELQVETSWTVLKSSRPWADMKDNGDTSRWMTADILVERDNIRWILDAKYKNDFRQETREDRFQVCAYSLGFDAYRATLVYPTQISTSEDIRLLLDANYAERKVRIDSIALPMADGPEVCKEKIRSLCM
jgi:5-methylcytosine-specific restriction endonuclease McrBC regulatory subunit McrC